jgi:hypothetical protein
LGANTFAYRVYRRYVLWSYYYSWCVLHNKKEIPSDFFRAAKLIDPITGPFSDHVNLRFWLEMDLGLRT